MTDEAFEKKRDITIKEQAEEIRNKAVVERIQKEWTPKHRKNCTVTFKKDDKDVKMHIMNYLRYLAQQLPPMQKGGKRVVHFDELRWLHLHGKTKDESQKAVSDYCEKMMDIYRKAVESAKQETETIK